MGGWAVAEVRSMIGRLLVPVQPRVRKCVLFYWSAAWSLVARTCGEPDQAAAATAGWFFAFFSSVHYFVALAWSRVWTPGLPTLPPREKSRDGAAAKPSSGLVGGQVVCCSFLCLFPILRFAHPTLDIRFLSCRQHVVFGSWCGLGSAESETLEDSGWALRAACLPRSLRLQQLRSASHRPIHWSTFTHVAHSRPNAAGNKNGGCTTMSEAG